MAEKPEETQTTPSAGEGAAQAAAAGGGLKTWLPLIVVVVLMPVLAYAMTTFVLVPQLQKSLGLQPAATEHGSSTGKSAKKEGPRVSVSMNKLLVNVAGTMGSRYLLVSLTAVSRDPSFQARMQEHDAELRDVACGILATKTLADLEKPGARNLVRTELINAFNNVLGEAMVEEIYLTEFAIQ
ncbi:flagellar basal body-associated FliL family protein [Limisphaera sp. VF-2]|jgi:flagellar FliL protein|uniref:flagellar basal body-associated FliL family protein n=1 Tax=Limisphaera sp. VF-2 TaxID=3400418 RepID=UPI00175C0E86|nr:flagellar basal body-associated FliL family protein [Limisphaera sp.]